MGFGFISRDAQEGTSVHKNDFWVDTEPGYSGAIDFDAELYDTEEWHDPSYADTGTATGTQTTTTLQDTSKSWTVNQFADHWVLISAGTGAAQRRKVVSNTSDTLTISGTWDTTPDGTSDYKIYINSRITVDSSGLYLISIGMDWESNSTVVGIRVDKNGSFFYVHFKEGPSATTEGGTTLTKVVELEADDYLEVQTYQGTSSNLRIIGASSRCWFQVTRI